MKTFSSPFTKLGAAIEKFARELEFKGDISKDNLGDEMVRRIKKGGRRNEAVYCGLSRLYQVVGAYEQFRAFSAEALVSEIELATENFYERYATAVELEADDREFEARKAKRAARKKQREVA